MILIADSGSTKTHWHLKGADYPDFYCEGINPYFQSPEEVYAIVKNNLPQDLPYPKAIFFFGAGCNHPDKNEIIEKSLKKIWPNIKITISSDLMGTCIATSINKKGICCILGTGSNSCYFNGVEIKEQIPPMGYLLGDEGSGAYLGKIFLRELFKKHFPQHLTEKIT
jgi:N-acetylglucosamine kinase-like BadF-type ATPase